MFNIFDELRMVSNNAPPRSLTLAEILKVLNDYRKQKTESSSAMAVAAISSDADVFQENLGKARIELAEREMLHEVICFIESRIKENGVLRADMIE